MVDHKTITQELWRAITEYTTAKLEHELHDHGDCYSFDTDAKLRAELDVKRKNLTVIFDKVTGYTPIFTPATEQNKWTESWKLE
jgi:hypothetical protein